MREQVSRKRQHGFTILEVSLYLGITSMLLLLVAGIIVMINRQRFQDTMTTLESNLRTQFEEVLSGVNDRKGTITLNGVSCTITTDGSTTTSNGNSATAGTSNCLILGRQIQFASNQTKFTVSYVISTRTPANTSSDLNALKDSQLRLASVASTGTIQWSNNFIRGVRLDNGEPFTTVTILRSPISSSTLVFFSNSTVSKDAALGSLESGTTCASTGSPVKLCTGVSAALLVENGARSSPGPGGAICFAQGSTSAIIRRALPIDPNPNDGYTGSGNGATNLTKLRNLCGQQ